MRKTVIIRSAGKKAAELAYPYRCPVCRKILRSDEGLICAPCYQKLPWVSEPTCISCGIMLEEGSGVRLLDRFSGNRVYCPVCERGGRLFRKGMSAFLYEKQIRDSVLRMKFHNQRSYIPFFARAMYVRSAAMLRRDPPAWLIPVPIHERKRRERGFDQCRLLTEEFSKLSGIPAAWDHLVRVRYTKPQKGLHADARVKNLKDAFAVIDPQDLAGGVLLIDDIYTSGATIDACCAALRAAGITDIRFLTLCSVRGRRR